MPRFGRSPGRRLSRLDAGLELREAEEVDEVFAHALKVGGSLLRKPEKTEYGGYRGYFADPDGHVWEVVQAPGFTLTADGRLILPD